METRAAEYISGLPVRSCQAKPRCLFELFRLESNIRRYNFLGGNNPAVDGNDNSGPGDQHVKNTVLMSRFATSETWFSRLYRDKIP